MVSSGMLRRVARNIPEDTILHSHCRETSNLANHKLFFNMLTLPQQLSFKPIPSSTG
jgi:hypothetical protein